jgi:hypothetical protein
MQEPRGRAGRSIRMFDLYIPNIHQDASSGASIKGETRGDKGPLQRANQCARKFASEIALAKSSRTLANKGMTSQTT